MRLAKNEDLPEIDKYCLKHNIRTPKEGLIFISQDLTGNIDGLICAQRKTVIEPMIADNPMIARRLYDMLYGAILSQGSQSLWVIPSKEELVKETEKLGYTVIDKVTILEKEV